VEILVEEQCSGYGMLAQLGASSAVLFCLFEEGAGPKLPGRCKQTQKDQGLEEGTSHSFQSIVSRQPTQQPSYSPHFHMQFRFVLSGFSHTDSPVTKIAAFDMIISNERDGVAKGA
jgi:hypothetical protein